MSCVVLLIGSACHVLFYSLVQHVSCVALLIDLTFEVLLFLDHGILVYDNVKSVQLQ